MRSPAIRGLLATALVLGGCSTPDPAPAPSRAADAPPAPPDTPAARAEAAGLSDAQFDALSGLGVPVYVSDLPDGWTLADATSALPGDGTALWPEYALRIRTSEQTCLALDGASEGIGDVFLDEPPNERGVRVPGVPTAGPARLGWGIAGERTEGWEDGRVATEWFGTDGLFLNVHSDDADGCAPASPEAAETLLESLRPLDPADDAGNVGPVARADEVEEAAGALPAGPDPEALALAAAAPDEPGAEPGAQQTAAATLVRRDRFAVVLVTVTGMLDDSVRDVRTRVVLARGPDGWAVQSAGRQVRCRPGRGPVEWNAGVCS